MTVVKELRCKDLKYPNCKEVFCTIRSNSIMAVMRYLQEAPHFTVQHRELLLGHLRE